jgi:tRNA dimethylallyltransferase
MEGSVASKAEPGVRDPVVLVGTTASGKTQIALDVARALGDVEIVSADSMTVYRGMDQGTSKPTAADRKEVPHHLVDVVDPSEEFTVAMYQRAARVALSDIAARHGQALLVGGTGLYVRAVVDDLTLPGRWPDVAASLEAEADEAEGLVRLFDRLSALDPAAAARVEPNNRRRIIRALEVTIGAARPFSSFGPGLEAYPPTAFRQFGLVFVPEEVDRRIQERFSRWIEDGLLEEVRYLSSRSLPLARTARQALGYRELLDHLEGRISFEQAIELAVARTRALARRQWAWFRRDPRIRWVHADEAGKALIETIGP